MSPESVVVVLPANLTWLSPVLAHLPNELSREPLPLASRQAGAPPPHQRVAALSARGPPHNLLHALAPT